MRAVVWTLVLAFCGVTFAATPYKLALTSKTNAYLTDGVVSGGQAGGGASLLGVRRAFSATKKIERIIVDLGDREARPAGKHISYFQASVDRGQKRVILDLAQLKMSLVNEAKLKQIFAKSPYVATVDFTLDPEDRAGTIVLNLKQPVALEVFELLTDKKPARIVMDIRPLAANQQMVTVRKKVKR